MDYPTAAFLVCIALVGLVSVIIYRLPHRTTVIDTARLEALLVENSVLAHDDTIAIITAIDELSSDIQNLRHIEPQTIEKHYISPVETPGNTVSTTVSITGTSKMSVIRQWLADNPETALSNREIAALLGVSHTLVNRVRK